MSCRTQKLCGEVDMLRTCNDSSYDELCEGESGGLQDHADKDHDGSAKGRPFPSVAVTDEVAR